MGKKKSPIPKLVYQYEGPSNNPGYIFVAANQDDEESSYQQKNESMLFIYSEDFEFMLPIVKAQFPLVDPHTGEEHETFDPCWNNPIVSERWYTILTELDRFQAENDEQRAFIDQFTTWIRARLEEADMIIIEGTL
jgi:hypothetical protein